MIVKNFITIFTLLVVPGVVAYTQPASSIKLQDLVNRIDHVPIVVPDLEEVRTLLGEQLKFTIKNGRVHEGINNFFVKFNDGTYLEFITPVDSTFSIGRYYADFLRNRAGGTAIALAVSSSDTVALALEQNHIAASSNSNAVWKVVEPAKFNLFYIEYLNKNWKERNEFTNHSNQSLALKTVWWVSKEKARDIANFTKLGLIDENETTYLDTPIHSLQAKTSEVFITDSDELDKLVKTGPVNEGIIGFTIQVKSLQTIKKLPHDQHLIIKENHAIYHAKKQNFFIIFSE